MAKNDETDLVDVGELPSEEDITEARRKVSEEAVPEPSATERDNEDEAGTEDPFAMQMEPVKPGQTTVASLRERLAAFLVDVGVLWLLFWGCLFVYHQITTHSWIGPVPTVGNPALIFHGIFLFVAFLYFFLLEASFFATIGKFCCWMYVRRKDGRHAGAFAIFIRNFFRAIEFLTAGLLAWVPMELSRRHQRLGDMAAGTIVIKKHAANAHYYSLDADQLASAFGRLIAQIIDLALVLVWLAGYVMLINYQATILSQWLVLLFPVLFILFWTLVQVILEGTPGLWLIGYTITHEDGGRLTFAGALLRVLLAPVDLVLGLPCMLLSLRKQKIGDLLAATVVSRQRRRWKGAIGSLLVIAISVGIAALGLFINPLNNVFKAGQDFKLSFMPLVEGLPDWESASGAIPPVLTLRNFRFGVNDPNTRRTPPVYEPGETVYLLFEIYGYARKDRMVWIQEDLMVQYPDGTIGLKQENVVDYHQIVKPGGGQIELTNNIALPPNAAPGTYVVTLALRDMLADKFLVTDTQSFTVKVPPTMTSPLEALPPAPPAPSPLPVEPSGGPAAQPGAPISGEGGTPSVPSSPIPVMPVAPSPQPPPPSEEGVPQNMQNQGPGMTPPPTTAVPTPAPVEAPAGGFTVLPGPSIAPKQDAAPVPTIPVPPPSATSPADQYGTKVIAPITPSVTTPSPASVPSPTGTPMPAPTAAPQATPPAIVEKTLTPTMAPSDQYGTTAPMPTPAPTPPIDAYAKPAAPVGPAPAVVPPTPATTPAKKATKTPAKAEPAPKEKNKVAPAPKEAKAAADAEIKKAAEKELQKLAPTKAAPTPAATPAKPAADIPSASAVKNSEPTPGASKAAPKKKKKAASGGGSSGGYMP